MGQVLCRSSHRSAHRSWKTCEQTGSLTTVSPTANSSAQTTHPRSADEDPPDLLADIKEVNKSYMKELQDLKKVIAEKEIKLTDSFILNTKYEHQTINFKEKHTEVEVNYDKQSVGEDLKKLDNVGKNKETQTCQDCIGKNSETKVYIKTCLEHFLKAKEGQYQCKKCDKIFTLNTENMEMFSHMIREHEGKQYMEKTLKMILCLYKHN